MVTYIYMIPELLATLVLLELIRTSRLFSLYIRETKQRRNQKSCEKKKNDFNFKVIFEEGGTRE